MCLLHPRYLPTERPLSTLKLYQGTPCAVPIRTAQPYLPRLLHLLSFLFPSRRYSPLSFPPESSIDNVITAIVQHLPRAVNPTVGYRLSPHKTRLAIHPDRVVVSIRLTTDLPILFLSCLLVAYLIVRDERRLATRTATGTATETAVQSIYHCLASPGSS